MKRKKIICTIVDYEHTQYADSSKFQAHGVEHVGVQSILPSQPPCAADNRCTPGQCQTASPTR